MGKFQAAAHAAHALTAMKPKKSNMLSGARIDPYCGESISVQLTTILSKNMVRVIDLFREWDSDGSGAVDRSEFRNGMQALGLYAPSEEVDALFSSWDPDGSGSLEISEMSKILRKQQLPPVSEMTFSKPRLDADKLAVNASPAQMRSRLTSLKQECENLDADHAECAAARMTYEHIETDLKELRRQHDRLSGQIESEQRNKEEIDRQSKIHAIQKGDTSLLRRQLESLRARNLKLRASEEKASDLSAAPREEKSLDHTRVELVTLQGEIMKQTLEMRQVTRRLEMFARSDLDAEHLHRMATGRDAATQESHLKAMSEVQFKGREQGAMRAATAAALREDWAKWQSLFAHAVRELQTRSAAGDMGARISASEAPDMALLDLLCRKENRRAVLKAREAEYRESESKLQQQLSTLRSKTATQKELLDAAMAACGGLTSDPASPMPSPAAGRGGDATFLTTDECNEL